MPLLMMQAAYTTPIYRMHAMQTTEGSLQQQQLSHIWWLSWYTKVVPV